MTDLIHVTMPCHPIPHPTLSWMLLFSTLGEFTTQQFMYLIILVSASSDLQDMTETNMSAAILDQPTQQKPKIIWGMTTGPAQSHTYHMKTSVKSGASTFCRTGKKQLLAAKNRSRHALFQKRSRIKSSVVLHIPNIQEVRYLLQLS